MGVINDNELKLENEILKSQVIDLKDYLSEHFNEDEEEYSKRSLVSTLNYIKSICKKNRQSDSSELSGEDNFNSEDNRSEEDGKETSDNVDEDLSITDYITMFVSINIYVERLKHEVLAYKLISFIAAAAFILFILILVFSDINVYFLM